MLKNVKNTSFGRQTAGCGLGVVKTEQNGLEKVRNLRIGNIRGYMGIKIQSTWVFTFDLIFLL